MASVVVFHHLAQQKILYCQLRHLRGSSRLGGRNVSQISPLGERLLSNILKSKFDDSKSVFERKIRYLSLQDLMGEVSVLISGLNFSGLSEPEAKKTKELIKDDAVGVKSSC